MLHSGLLFFPLSLLLLHFSSLQLISSQDTQPDKYFIACGSKSNTTLNDSRVFVGEQDPPFFLSHGGSKEVTDSNRSNDTPFLYHTARVFEQPSLYELQVEKNGTYMVRLHFYSFSSPINLSDAVFDVWASGFWLLSNFSVRKSSTLVIEEFLLTIKVGKFRLYFQPSQNSRLAFVNAIEVFLVPANFIPDSVPQVTSAGQNRNFSKLLSLMFRSVHRINVGGDEINPESDTLWRTWLPDDVYLTNPEAAKKSDVYDGTLDFRGGATNFIAPDYVYKTARELNLSASKQANPSNVSWAFPVSEHVMKHLVRVHFCDIIGTAINIFDFNLFIYTKFRRKINSYQDVGFLGAPFYFDFVVDSNGSRSLNISIVSVPENSSSNPTAFLNGVEIFEIQGKSASFVAFESQHKKNKIGLFIGLPVGFAVVGILFSVFLVFKRRKAKIKKTSGELLYGGMSSHGRLDEITSIIPIAPNLNLSLKISLADIQLATSNFDGKMLVGEGGFGKVYKGTLNDIKVAVKRSQPGHGQGLSEFHTEILVLSQIRHRHLVSLIGYCDEESEMILVYEFMENGTLRDHLYDSKSESPRSSTEFKLSWEKRLEICIGAAKGLHYLHSGSAKGIIHRDVKSTNILLDDKFVAKVADFGLSKSGLPDPNNESMVVKGSFGYLDPEYIRSSQYTVKSDVYAFGVVLLEALCAKPAIFTQPQEEEKVSLAKWWMSWHRKGQIEHIIDPLLAGDIHPNSLRVVTKTVENCLKENGFERPKMDEVEWDLRYALNLQKNSTLKEPHEDTTTNTSLESAFPSVHQMPSNAFPVAEDDASIIGDGYSSTFTTQSIS